MGRRLARPIPGTRRRLLYSTGTATGVIGLGVALMASPVLAEVATTHNPFGTANDADAQLTGGTADTADTGQNSSDDSSGHGSAGTATSTPHASRTASPSPSGDPATTQATVTPTSTTTWSATATNPADTPQADPTTSSTNCHTDAPVTLVDYIAEHGESMTRISCTSDAAVYYDQSLQHATGTEWIAPFATDVWRYIKDSYGTCAAARDLPAVDGTGCTNFGAPKPALYLLHQGRHEGATVTTRFQAEGDHRTTIDIGRSSRESSDPQVHDLIVAQACRQVELAGQGTAGAPAQHIWGDSAWVQFCVHDFYAGTGRTDDAERTERSFATDRTDLPSGSVDTAWFRDWFLPLWEDGGRSPEVMRRYFELTAQYFPTSTNDDGDLSYARDLTVGEYVLFTSAAAGKDLSSRAAQAFGGGFSQAEFAQAQKDFPELTF